jgi:lipopolysaccharide exporter
MSIAPAVVGTSALGRTAIGTGWVIGWRMATRLLGVGSTLVLVRLLIPADFGLVALATGFAQAVEGFASLGVEDAVIRHPDPTREVYDAGFTLNVLRGLATAAVIGVLAFPAADFFAEPRLVPILAALAGASLLDGLANIGVVAFRREFAFGKEFQLWILPRILAIILTIAVAVVRHSYWALVVGILAQRLLRVAFSYRMHPFRPRLSLRGRRGLVGYSAWSWAICAAALVRDRCDTVIIGRLLDSSHLGLYALGAELGGLPTSELVEPLSRAAFAGFAAGRRAAEQPGATYMRIIGVMAMLTLPAGAGLSLVAAPLIRLAFGPSWDSAAPLVAVSGLAGMGAVLATIGATLLSAHALLERMLRITLGVAALRIGLLVILTPRYGVLGAAVAVAISMIVEQIVYLGLTLRRFAIPFVDLARAVQRSVLATAIMVAVMAATGLGWHAVSPDMGSVVGLLGRQIAAGIGIYGAVLGLGWLVCGRPAGAEIDLATLLRRLIRR